MPSPLISGRGGPGVAVTIGIAGGGFLLREDQPTVLHAHKKGGSHIGIDAAGESGAGQLLRDEAGDRFQDVLQAQGAVSGIQHRDAGAAPADVLQGDAAIHGGRYEFFIAVAVKIGNGHAIAADVKFLREGGIPVAVQVQGIKFPSGSRQPTKSRLRHRRKGA